MGSGPGKSAPAVGSVVEEESASGAASVEVESGSWGSIARRVPLCRGARSKLPPGRGSLHRLSDQVGPHGDPRAEHAEPDAGARYEQPDVAGDGPDADRQDPEEVEHQPAERVRGCPEDAERQGRA